MVDSTTFLDDTKIISTNGQTKGQRTIDELKQMSNKRTYKDVSTDKHRIYKYFPPPDDLGIDRPIRWKLDRLLYDPYNKKKKHK